MKKLMSDGVIATLKKIPIPVWYLLFAISAMFTELYALIFQGQETLAYLATMFEQMPDMNINRVLWIYYPMVAAMEVVIFELIVWVAYSIFSRRSFVTLPLKEFAFRVRFLMIIANVIIGLFALIYFALPESSYIIGNTVPTLVTGLILIFMMKHMISVYVVPSLRKKSYLYVARLYLGIYLAFALYAFILSFVTDASTLEMIGAALGVVSILVLILTAYLVYPKIPTDGGGDNNDDNIFKVEIVEERNDKIFRDFDI